MEPFEIDDKGHRWKREDDGAIDIFGVEWGHHNGPICVNCGYGFCHHCQELPGISCTVVEAPRQPTVKLLPPA